MPLSQLKTHLLIDFDEIYSATGFAPSYTRFPSYIAADARQWMLRGLTRGKFLLKSLLQLIWVNWKEAWEHFGRSTNVIGINYV